MGIVSTLQGALQGKSVDSALHVVGQGECVVWEGTGLMVAGHGSCQRPVFRICVDMNSVHSLPKVPALESGDQMHTAQCRFGGNAVYFSYLLH